MAKKPLRSSHTVKLKNDRILQAFTWYFIFECLLDAKVDFGTNL